MQHRAEICTVAVQADWIFITPSHVMPLGWVVCSNGQIIYVGQELPQQFNSVEKFKLKRTAITPGLFNSHCHLEFSDLPSPFPFNGSFIEWIGSVVRHRRNQIPSDLDDEQSREWLIELRANALNQGLKESYETGTRYLVDTITSPWPMDQKSFAIDPNLDPYINKALLGGHCIFYHACPEVLDINELRRAQTLSFSADIHHAIKHRYAERHSPNWADHSMVKLLKNESYSPHAPYTATPRLVAQLARYCDDSLADTLSIHLAESDEETRWLKTGEGPIEQALAPFRGEEFAEYHRNQRALNEATQNSPYRVYLEATSAAKNVLLAHGNEFLEADLNWIASRNQWCQLAPQVSIRERELLSLNFQSSNQSNQHPSRIGIVHCPRTFSHFHPNRSQGYPLLDRLSRGVPHLIGTDSKASNPDLSIWSEILALITRGITLSTALALATSEPALFFDQPDLGSVSPGYQSKLTAISLGDDCISPTLEMDSNSALNAIHSHLQRTVCSSAAHKTFSQPLELALTQNHNSS